jgi:S-adenosylmethionine:tRNA ribosyltransferase-isomerase
VSPRASLGAAPSLVAASTPTQRPADARLLVITEEGTITTRARRDWVELLRAGDLVIANDAATMPASLRATHLGSGRAIEIRLAARRSLDPDDLVFDAVIFGEGDHRTRTEDRKEPPRLEPGDRLAIDGTSLIVGVLARLGHRRFVRLAFHADPRAFWSMLARLGRPVQYAHVPEPLRLWDVWTVLAGPPVAFEPPSAGFVLDWACLDAIHARGAGFATLTHAAGLSSTGDPKLDARLPLDEPYAIPAATAHAIRETRARSGRVIAIGTTVVRAIEHAVSHGPLTGERRGVADQRIGRASTLRAIDVIVSGTHEPGTSHRELLRAFASDEVLTGADHALAEQRFRTHEFGDSVWIEASRGGARKP